jgi:tRNA C32,U32 (ribose-2'-O)-methylase TrmJ
MSTIGLLDRISFVLCRPRYGGNIGAAARAVKNMGIGRLVLVAPEDYRVAEARKFASNATDILEGAATFDTMTKRLPGAEWSSGLPGGSRATGSAS